MGRPCGLGYSKSVRVDPNIPEIITNAKLVPNKNFYYLKGHRPVKNRVIIGTTDKKHCQVDWKHLENVFRSRGREVIVLGEKGVRLSSYKRLFDVMCTAERFVGVDSGLMHLADILHIPMIVFWDNPKDRVNEVRTMPRNNFALLQIGQEYNWEVLK